MFLYLPINLNLIKEISSIMKQARGFVLGHTSKRVPFVKVE